MYHYKPEQMKQARRLFLRIARQYPRAFVWLRECSETVRNWERFTYRAIAHSGEAHAEKQVIKHLHKLTMKLEKESAERVARELMRRSETG